MASDAAEIEELTDVLMDAWNRGDANAFGARYRADGTFTNVNGTYHFGKDAFNRRHAEVFGGVFKGTTLSIAIRNLRFLTTDVAVVDAETTISNCSQAIRGMPVGVDGAAHTSLLMVLIKDAGEWGITAYHNVWRAAVS